MRGAAMFLLPQRTLIACACLHRLSRAAFSTIPDISTLNLVRSVDKSIDSNSSIFVESPIHVRVMPLIEAMSAPDKLVMQLYSKEKSPYDFNVKQSSKRLELVNKMSSGEHSTDVCVLRVPHQLNVRVEATANAAVDISKIMAEEVQIVTQKGSVYLDGLRANSIKVESTEGNVHSTGRLEAKVIDLKTGDNTSDSAIECNNIISESLKVVTHSGPINIESCYSDCSHFITALGNIRLQHVQKACIVEIIQKGTLRVGGLEGSLQASLKSGEAYVHASKLVNKSTIFIHEQGHVEMKLVELLAALSVNLIGAKIEVEEEIKKLGRYMDGSGAQWFRYPLTEVENQEDTSELTVQCRNGKIELKKSNIPFMLKNSK